MNTLTLEELDRLGDLFNKGTPKPWHGYSINAILRYGRKHDGPWNDDEGTNCPTDDDSDLIVEMHDALPQLLSLARRQLEQQEAQVSPEGIRPPTSACAPPADSDVLPFKVERYGNVEFEDRFGDKMFLKRRPETQTMEILILSDEGISLKEKNVRSLVAHLQSWLDHGSFELKPRAVDSDCGNMPSPDELEQWMVDMWNSVETVAGCATMAKEAMHESVTDLLDTFYMRRPEGLIGPTPENDDSNPYVRVSSSAQRESKVRPEVEGTASHDLATDQSSDGKGGVA